MTPDMMETMLTDPRQWRGWWKKSLGDPNLVRLFRPLAGMAIYRDQTMSLKDEVYKAGHGEPVEYGPSPQEVLSAYIDGVMLVRGRRWFEWLADQDWGKNSDPHHRDTDEHGRRFFAVVFPVHADDRDLVDEGTLAEILVYEDGKSKAGSVLPLLPVVPEREPKSIYPRMVSSTWEIPKGEEARMLLQMSMNDLLSRMPGGESLFLRNERVDLAIEKVEHSDRKGYALVTVSVKRAEQMPATELRRFRLRCDDCNATVEFDTPSFLQGLGPALPDDEVMPEGWCCVLKVGIPGLRDTERFYYCPNCAGKHEGE